MVVRAGVVTPEAVLLDLPTAGVATRAFSRLVDLAIQLLVGGILAFAMGQVVGLGMSPVLGFLLVFTLTLLGWPILIEALMRGRSVGKALFGLRVIGADGSPVQLRQTVVRSLLALIDIYLSIGFVAVITAMFSPVSQRLGDMAASTVVIRERRNEVGWTPVVFYPPTGFEHYVANLDVSRMEPDDFALVRSLLLRVGRLTRDARFHVTLHLAEGLRRRISHELPGSVDPETWLICVASAYQWREGNLLREVAAGVAPVALPQAGRVLPGR